MGEPNEFNPGMSQFYENPSPCICQDNVKAKAWEVPYSRKQLTHDIGLEGSGKMDYKTEHIGAFREEEFAEEEWHIL